MQVQKIHYSMCAVRRSAELSIYCASTADNIQFSCSSQNNYLFLILGVDNDVCARRHDFSYLFNLSFAGSIWKSFKTNILLNRRFSIHFIFSKDTWIAKPLKKKLQTESHFKSFWNLMNKACTTDRSQRKLIRQKNLESQQGALLLSCAGFLIWKQLHRSIHPTTQQYVQIALINSNSIRTLIRICSARPVLLAN
jgi:hypothetical protein